MIGKTICTSFVNLSRQYFLNLERQAGFDNQNKISTKIVELSGSVEAACALGVADGVIDLVGKCLYHVIIGLLD